MGLFNNCLLACDIDGTLMASGYINPKNIEKIEYFMSQGGKFSLSTGRSIGAIGDVLKQVKVLSPSVMANGCIIYDYNNKNTIYEAVIPREEHKIAEIVLNSGINIGIEIHCREKVYTLKSNDATISHQVYEGLVSKDITFPNADKLSWNKVNYIFDFDCEEDIIKVKELISNQESSCDYIDTCASIFGKLQKFHEQIPKGVSKATSILKLCDILNIEKTKLFAIGDFYNDLEMIKLANISAVPIDSPEDIKKFAQYITCECKNGAVADFIDYLTKLYAKG